MCRRHQASTMDVPSSENAEVNLEARISCLEMQLQQQGESSAEMMRSLSSKVDTLMQLLVASHTAVPPQPAPSQPCHAVSSNSPNLGVPWTSASQPNHSMTRAPPPQLQQADRTDQATANNGIQLDPGVQRTLAETIVTETAGQSHSLSSPSSSFVKIPDSLSSSPDSSSMSASWDKGEDIISNSPVPSQVTQPLAQSSSPQGLNVSTDERGQRLSMDFPDDDLFASRLPSDEGRDAQHESPQGVNTEAGAGPPKNDPKDWISNAAAAPTSDPRTPTCPSQQGPQTAAQASSGVADHPACNTRPAAPLPERRPVQEGMHADQSECDTQTSPAGPNPGARSSFHGTGHGPKNVQFSADSDAPTRESRRSHATSHPHKYRLADGASLEAAADKILKGLRVSTTGAFRETVMRALTEEHPSPRAVTAQTVLCLDCSPSIGSEGLSAMKAAALAFVSGIEEMAERYGVDENLGVVTFGSSTEVAQHITIDYQAVREAIESATLGGLSPLFEALLVSVASFTDRGGCLSIAHVHTVRPRVVIFSDGIATQTTSSEGVEIYDTTPTHRRMPLIQLVTEIARHSGTPCPLVWVPVGNADKDFLRNLAKIGKGKYVEPENISKECHYYLFHTMVGKAYLCLRDTDPKSHNDECLRALVDAIFGDVAEIDKDELVRTLKEKLTKKEEEKTQATDFSHFLERPKLPPLGTRMVRGKGWRWEDQDEGGMGTVINHCGKDTEWLYVQWDHGGYNRYRYLAGGEGDVTETESPRFLREGETIAVGVRVKRGPQWNQGNSDGGPASIGVVVRVKDDVKIRVRWPNGKFGKFHWGEDGKQYLELVDKEENTLSKHVYQETRTAPAVEMPDDTSGKRKVVVWQRSPTGKEGDWTYYDEDTKTRLENQFLARPQSTCVIDRDGESRRVSFKKMEEWKIADHSSKNLVRRLLEDAED